jgi:hypothetical protein
MMYRNKKLRDSAKFESCVSCGVSDGTIVWCHINSQKHGKGMGIKAHDLFGIFICTKCHDWFDRGSENANYPQCPDSYSWHNQKDSWFIEMWEKSMIIACEKGYLK